MQHLNSYHLFFPPSVSLTFTTINSIPSKRHFRWIFIFCILLLYKEEYTLEKVQYLFFKIIVPENENTTIVLKCQEKNCKQFCENEICLVATEIQMKTNIE
uniref:Uncharacterized protein n=1 Tax=Micrurus paraensis TaxID=1970185 RepID=A0A2D4KT48_9SAUR